MVIRRGEAPGELLRRASELAGEIQGLLAGGAALPDDLYFNLNLAVEEFATNIAKHGVFRNGSITAVFRVAIHRNGACLVVTDDAAPFDPTAIAAPSLNEAAGDRAVGGLGIHLVRRLSSSFEHRIRDGWNTTVVHFACGAQPAG